MKQKKIHIYHKNCQRNINLWLTEEKSSKCQNEWWICVRGSNITHKCIIIFANDSSSTTTAAVAVARHRQQQQQQRPNDINGEIFVRAFMWVGLYFYLAFLNASMCMKECFLRSFFFRFIFIFCFLFLFAHIEITIFVAAEHEIGLHF